MHTILYGSKDSSKYFQEGQLALDRLAKSLYSKYMENKQENEIKRREKILVFWKTHGDLATKDAFGISRRTLYRWQKDIKFRSRAHKEQYAKRLIEPVLVTEIQRLRSIYPRLGKEKLTPLLKDFCYSMNLKAPSEPTIGRMLSQLRSAGKLPDPKKLRIDARTGNLNEKRRKKIPKLRRNGYLPALPGDLLQLDGVLTFVDGQRRYTFTAIDLVSRFAVSHTYTSASSRNGKDFLQRVINTMPFSISHIQTDNGSEFLKELEKWLRRRN